MIVCRAAIWASDARWVSSAGRAVLWASDGGADGAVGPHAGGLPPVSLAIGSLVARAAASAPGSRGVSADP